MAFETCISSSILRGCNRKSTMEYSPEMEEAILDLTVNRNKKCETCFFKFPKLQGSICTPRTEAKIYCEGLALMLNRIQSFRS